MLLLKERRFQKRVQVTLPVNYVYTVDQRVVTKNSSTDNLSDSGLSFYSDRPLKKGSNLRVQLNHIWDVPKDSRVMWCNRKKYNLYKIGVVFQ